jgi:DNA-binding NarL/FixJ family response regulator
MKDYEGRCWLLKFKPALEPQSKVAYAMHQAQLTTRETEVASLACDGFTDKQIAQRLCISPSTVNNHLKNIFKKMEVTSRVQLARHLQGIMKERGKD